MLPLSDSADDELPWLDHRTGDLLVTDFSSHLFRHSSALPTLLRLAGPTLALVLVLALALTRVLSLFLPLICPTPFPAILENVRPLFLEGCVDCAEDWEPNSVESWGESVGWECGEEGTRGRCEIIRRKLFCQATRFKDTIEKSSGLWVAIPLRIRKTEWANSGKTSR